MSFLSFVRARSGSVATAVHSPGMEPLEERRLFANGFYFWDPTPNGPNNTDGTQNLAHAGPIWSPSPSGNTGSASVNVDGIHAHTHLRINVGFIGNGPNVEPGYEPTLEGEIGSQALDLDWIPWNKEWSGITTFAHTATDIEIDFQGWGFGSAGWDYDASWLYVEWSDDGDFDGQRLMSGGDEEVVISTPKDKKDKGEKDEHKTPFSKGKSIEGLIEDLDEEEIVPLDALALLPA